MLPPERRLPAVLPLIVRGQYFVVHAPRQSGKTTFFRTLAGHLTAEGRYTALLTTCETGQTLERDLDSAMNAVLQLLRQKSGETLPADLQPPEPDPSMNARTRLYDLLARWSRQGPRPLVLFLDEIDSLVGDVLNTVLRQLRAGYDARPESFPHAVALIGLRDVRDYRLASQVDAPTLGTASPFNVKVESLTLPNFTASEVADLYEQHTADTGQVFTPQAKALAWKLTRGQPWLVNALARQAVEVIAPDPAQTVGVEVIESAKEKLVQRRDTHLDSLIDRLRETRVRRVIEPILAGETLAPEVMDDDVQLAIDLGLVAASPRGLEIANPIYREVIPRALTSVLEHSLSLPRASYMAPDGRLRFDLLVSDFRDFWCEHAESFLAKSPYSEAAAQLIFMAFLQKVVNGGGFIDRELAVGSGRVDLCVRWPHPEGIERWAVELKVWRTGQPDPPAAGLRQLTEYLKRLGLDRGTLVIFDMRAEAPALPERCSIHDTDFEGRRITVVRL